MSVTIHTDCTINIMLKKGLKFVYLIDKISRLLLYTQTHITCVKYGDIQYGISVHNTNYLTIDKVFL